MEQERARTVRNRLRDVQLHGSRPYIGILLSHGHRQARLNWQEHIVDGLDSIGIKLCLQTNSNSVCNPWMEGYSFGGELGNSAQARL